MRPTCGTVGVCPALLTLTQVWAVNVLTGAPIPTWLHCDTLVHIYISTEKKTWAVLNVTLYVISFSTIIWQMGVALQEGERLWHKSKKTFQYLCFFLQKYCNKCLFNCYRIDKELSFKKIVWDIFFSYKFYNAGKTDLVFLISIVNDMFIESPWPISQFFPVQPMGHWQV